MKKNKLSTAQQKRLGIIALVIAIVVMGLLVWLVGVPLVRFASQPERFRAWVDSHGFGGRLAVDVVREGAQVRDLYLTGPTNIVCKGEITDEEL